jgi:protein-L-isoaspartate(D-aspartate) O-methyltransferase
MFETLKNLLAFHGSDSKALVLAHTSHVGNAAATEMAARGKHNIGQLCRQEFGDHAYLVGFGTHGARLPQHRMGGPTEIKNIRPALPDSYEQLCHASGHARFMLSLRGRGDLCGPKGRADGASSGPSA